MQRSLGGWAYPDHIISEKHGSEKRRPTALTLDPETVLRNELSSFESDAGGRAGLFESSRRKYDKRKRRSDIGRGISRLLGRREILRCFREDVETTRRTLPWDNVDLSKAIPHDGTARSPQAAAATSHEIFRLISEVDEIHTDRLHMAISGALLGKRVLLYPNSYYKNKAIYEYSLARVYPSVEWMGD